MKKIIIVLLGAISLVITSCDGSVDSQEQQGEPKIKKLEVLPDSVKQHLIEQDSLYRSLVEQVDTITKKMNDTRLKMAKLSKEIKEKKEPSALFSYLSIFSFILSIVSLVLLWKLFKSKVNKEQTMEIIRKYPDVSGRFNKLDERIGQLEAKTPKKSVSSSTPSLSSNDIHRITMLERKVSEIEKFIIGHQNSTKNSMNSSKPQIPLLTRYAKLNDGKYFMDLYDSNQEGCVFILNLKNEKIGEFDIISLDKIRSRNAWKDVVDASGVSIEDASGYKVDALGTCEKTNGGYWKVTNNLKITFIK